VVLPRGWGINDNRRTFSISIIRLSPTFHSSGQIQINFPAVRQKVPISSACWNFINFHTIDQRYEILPLILFCSGARKLILNWPRVTIPKIKLLKSLPKVCCFEWDFLLHRSFLYFDVFLLSRRIFCHLLTTQKGQRVKKTKLKSQKY